MNNSMKIGIFAGVCAIAMILSATSSNPLVYAQNEWGKLASDMGKAGKMGKHASDPDHDGEKGQDDSPRNGVGNLDLDEDGERDHPSETANTLRGICDSIPGDDPACP